MPTTIGTSPTPLQSPETPFSEGQGHQNRAPSLLEPRVYTSNTLQDGLVCKWAIGEAFLEGFIFWHRIDINLEVDIMFRACYRPAMNTKRLTQSFGDLLRAPSHSLESQTSSWERSNTWWTFRPRRKIFRAPPPPRDTLPAPVCTTLPPLLGNPPPLFILK